MTKLEEVARALAVYQFGSDESWEDQIPMARAAVEAVREPCESLTGIAYQNSGYTGDSGGHERGTVADEFDAMLDAILSEKPE